MSKVFRKHTLRALHLISTLPPPPIPTDPHAPHTSALPELQRLAYRLHDVEGLHIKEIAGVMGIRPARVKRALERARGMLAERVGSAPTSPQ